MASGHFLKAPKDFQPNLEAAGCYCEYEDKLLFLKRHPDKYQGNTWGIPGGKLEEGETPAEAVRREIGEEVGITLQAQNLVNIGNIYTCRDDIRMIFYIFCTRFIKMPVLTLNLQEHTEARWVNFSQVFDLPLIAGGQEALQFYMERKKTGERMVGRIGK